MIRTLKNELPGDIARLCMGSDALAREIRALKAKPHPRLVDLRRLVILTNELLRFCPPTRFAWVDGLPVIDILKILHEKESRK
jgi:hypothetical protein